MGTKRDKARDKKVAKWDKNRGSGSKVGQDKGQRKQSGKRPRREKIKLDKTRNREKITEHPVK